MALGSLAGRDCFVTGAASGIGRATALAAARRGARLHLTDVAADGLAETAELARRAGAAVLTSAPADLTDRDAVAALAERVRAEHGSVDAVFNVAGVSTWGPIEELPAAEWSRMIEINLRGPIAVLEHFVPPMIEAGRGGQIVNVASAAALFGLPWHAAYSASKFGLRGVSEVLRFDLRRHGIGVTLVCPGAVRTPLVGTMRLYGADREAPAVQRLVKRFERHAIAPERAAEKIVRGAERDRYLVFTSFDVRLGHWAQRWCPPLYELAMRRMNDELVRAAGRS